MDHDYTYLEPLKQGDVILILGATGGDFILSKYREIIHKNVFVINVEPTNEGIAKLSQVILTKTPQNACILSTAVSDTIGNSVMTIRDNLITSTLESRNETNDRWPMKLLYTNLVPVLTLDTILDMFPNITKVFCDIEGSELEVFGASKRLQEIPYYAIAAYHLRDGRETWYKLSEIFSGFSVEITGKASRLENEVVFFARK
jgi:FkbM family methyltransferase